jgi:hypothetical protein
MWLFNVFSGQKIQIDDYPLVMADIAIENGHL